MADYADSSEIEKIEKMYANYPSISEIRDMCYELGIQKDNLRTIEEADAWVYYHELKAMIEKREAERR